MNKKEDLAELLIKIVSDPELEKKDIDGDGVDETWCNRSVHIAATHFGYHEFRGEEAGQAKLANQIHQILKDSDRWELCTAEQAHAAACNGDLVVAAKSKPRGHGHVVSVYPGPMVYSGKYAGKTVLVANVGQKNGIMGANFAFGGKEEPEFYRLLPA